MSATNAKQLPDVSQLARVAYDRDRSTRDAQVFWVASKREINRRYKHVLDADFRSRSCECTAALYGNRCEHATLAEVYAWAKWWEKLLLDCAPGELRDLIPGKEAQVANDVDAISAFAALLVIDALLVCSDEAAA
jgi:hypothetical protein